MHSIKPITYEVLGIATVATTFTLTYIQSISIPVVTVTAAVTVLGSVLEVATMVME